MFKTEIDYIFDGFLVAFKITFLTNNKIDGVYYSPFVFQNCQDAYDNALMEIARK